MYDNKSPMHDISIRRSNRRLRCLLTALIPSFLLPVFTATAASARRVTPTAWLDGMRGYAAFFVFLRHFEFAYHRKGAFVYGTVEDPDYPDENRHILQLPILRLLVAGESMVCIFFVISGYALSLKSLKLIRSHSHAQLMRTLASSVFRRPFRLFLPCIASTLLIFVALRVGIFDYPNTLGEDEVTFRMIYWGWAHEPQPHVFETFNEQLWDYIHATKGLFDIMSHAHWPSHGYDIHLWTIPVEFRCSMVLFLTIAALSIVRTRVRMITLGLLIAGSFQCDVWELGLFWSGMFLAEASLIQESFSDVEAKIEEGAPMHKEPPKHSESENKAFWYFAFVVGLVLLSIPPQKTEFAPFYSNLIKWSPQGLREGEKHRFWMAIGSVLVIWSINNALSLQGIFSCALGRYLGNISYALYLVHGFINHTLGYSVVYNLWENTTGKSTTRQYETGFALGGLIVIPAAIWAADLFWRYIDTPIVKFTRWLENQLLEPV
ncbi:hypothetical protein AAFC00_004538 [Neodothiora populina]|uniref:Acyltransferase 3 domain-containing protein n=3 Tax=Neodothiora populina TaxID=2781224 RepID=A0ABR3P2N1_9PEZI